MTIDYRPQQVLRLYFESDKLINIRVVVNGDTKVIQCRKQMTFVQPIDIEIKNTITIENLTNDAVCNIVKVCLNYLDLTKVVYQWSKTYTKDNMIKIGDFVSDLYGPDICVMEIKEYVYADLLKSFKDGAITYHAP